MESSVLSPSSMAVVGVTTVFVALVLLIAAVSLLSFFLRRSLDSAEPSTTVPAVKATTTEKEASSEETYRLVALAAYAFHLRNSVSVVQPRSPSPWLRAGRQQQVQRGRGA